ncbi:leukocyte-associated immunoglobulin-like receptor 1 [Diceros bicornis minor]|uniref:leukocyte-associated immunoglobulin-like receptor 1 n=1 Tax=Diceros bicornis minor TaxID=77932 RepID=UPI0026F040A4|nr:leukocyte-associated immunoglobulin-like receptor 1 [Diceros bicornis minor]
MSPHRTSLLGLVLCLSQMTHVQDGALPTPSISAEPGPVIPRGQPVTIVCRGPDGAKSFRLEKEDRRSYRDQHTVSQLDPHGTEARFPITAVSDDSAGRYRCLYHGKFSWSKHSNILELEVTEEDVSTLPSGLSTEYIYILIGVSVAFLICLFLLVIFFLHRQHQKKLGLPSSRGKEQRPQERLSPDADILERTPDLATVDSLAEKDRKMHNSTSAAGGLQEVTYAQLDHRMLTQRAAQAMTPQSTEPTAESSTYATLARH